MDQLLKLVLVCILFVFAEAVIAQKKGYEVGYIVTLKGDTLQGWIMDRSPEPFVSIFDQIRFKQKGRLRKKLGPAEIQGYQVSNNIFHSVAFTETFDMWRIRYIVEEQSPRNFLKLIRNSEYLLLYHQEFTYDDNDFVDFFPMLYLPGSGQLVRATQGILGLKRKLLSEYFSECPALVDEINQRNSSLSNAHDVFEFYLDHCIRE